MLTNRNLCSKVSRSSPQFSIGQYTSHCQFIVRISRYDIPPAGISPRCSSSGDSHGDQVSKDLDRATRHLKSVCIGAVKVRNFEQLFNGLLTSTPRHMVRQQRQCSASSTSMSFNGPLTSTPTHSGGLYIVSGERHELFQWATQFNAQQ